MVLDLRVGEVAVLAGRAGFEIAGVTGAGPTPDYPRYQAWIDRGNAGPMGYLADHRAALRADVRTLLPEAKSVICVGKLYNGPEPYSTAFSDPERGWIARYAWGEDYHRIMRSGLEELARLLAERAGPFAWKACVDTAPVLERSLAREAGLGWIGKNTCLINQSRGSWFFLAELITSLPLEAGAEFAADRCGSCSRCIDACPTRAIVPAAEGRYEIDSRLCIASLTIEQRGPISEELRGRMGARIFGCDICQDVCPWNGRAPVSERSKRAVFAPPLARMAALSESEFRDLFRHTPVERAKYRGFLRNVAIAMGNSGSARMRDPLRKLAGSNDALVAEHAAWALAELEAALADEGEPEKECAELSLSS